MMHLTDNHTMPLGVVMKRCTQSHVEKTIHVWNDLALKQLRKSSPEGRAAAIYPNSQTVPPPESRGNDYGQGLSSDELEPRGT